MKVSQADRILRVLRLGITDQRAWNNPADGGEPIPQIARRIHDLRKRGCVIEDVGLTGCKFIAYRLVSEPSSCPRVSPAGQAPAADPSPLEHLRPATTSTQPRCALFDDDWEDAA